jgi:hypothetical protein
MEPHWSLGPLRGVTGMVVLLTTQGSLTSQVSPRRRPGQVPPWGW